PDGRVIRELAVSEPARYKALYGESMTDNYLQQTDLTDDHEGLYPNNYLYNVPTEEQDEQSEEENTDDKETEDKESDVSDQDEDDSNKSYNNEKSDKHEERDLSKDDIIGLLEQILKQSKNDKSDDDKNDERSEEHTSELQSRFDLVCRLLLEKKKKEQSMKRYYTST